MTKNNKIKNKNETTKPLKHKIEDNNRVVKKLKTEKHVIIAKNNIAEKQLTVADKIGQKQLVLKKKGSKNIASEEKKESCESEIDEEMTITKVEDKENIDSENEDENDSSDVDDDEDVEEEDDDEDDEEEDDDEDDEVDEDDEADEGDENENDEEEEDDEEDQEEDDDKIVLENLDKNNVNNNKVNDTNNILKMKYQEHRVVVTNLSVDTTFPDIVKFFSNVAPVVKLVMTNSETFKFGLQKPNSLRAIVIFEDSESVVKALEYNDTEIKGRKILIQSDPRIAFQPRLTVFMRYLKPGTTEEEIKEFFSECGEVKHIVMKHDGQVAIRFDKEESVHQAVALNNSILNESKVLIHRHNNYKSQINLRNNLSKKPSHCKKPSTLKPKFSNQISPQFEANLIKKIENKIMWKLKNMNKK